jgi:hypothetical protein
MRFILQNDEPKPNFFFFWNRRETKHPLIWNSVCSCLIISDIYLKAVSTSGVAAFNLRWFMIFGCLPDEYPAGKKKRLKIANPVHNVFALFQLPTFK